MDDTTVSAEDRHDDFLSAEAFAVLKEQLSEFSSEPGYDALDRYYLAANETAEVAEQIIPVKLLRTTFESLFGNRTAPLSDAAEQVWLGFEQYTTRLAATAVMLSPLAKPVPNIMHFVWVGGSEVGAIQRDYMNIWRQVLAPQGCQFNLWYDSDALLAFKMNRVILDSARVHAMESKGDEETVPWKLSKMIEERARVLKRQMWDFLNQPHWVGRADEARIDLMVRAYGEDRATLEAFRQQCLDTHLAMAGSDLRLRDAGQEFRDHFLRDVYLREVAMRGNFAAASDVVRLQAEHSEGGRYSDMDYLPALAKKLGGVDISAFGTSARIGVLQLLLDHDNRLMPGRDRQRYRDWIGLIPEEHKEALLAFALGKPGVSEIFVPPQECSVAPDGFRMGTSYGSLIGGEMNAHFLAHPGSGMTQAIMQTIRFNYDCLNEVERRAAAAGIAWENVDLLREVAQKVVNERTATRQYTEPHQALLTKLPGAICTYYQDGIRIGARSTITLTGPGAAVAGLGDYIETHLVADHLNAVRDRLKLLEGYNLGTEEEMISGWTENGSESEWLTNEKEKWTSGKLKSRYIGNLKELLKEQTLTFERGWPVIEGRRVLLTSVLQQLLDDLGEPFVRVMNDRLSGDVTFHTAFSIGFDERQQILAQPDSKLPPSVGAESLGNLNEAFTRIAAGKLPMEHLSPAHRVVLGGLFGATSLDEQGFAEAWEATCALAKNTEDRGLVARYELIEQALRNRAPAGFEAGLNTPPSPVQAAQSSRELRVLAFAEPLSVRQWGACMARVETTARQEYQASILKRGNPLRALMYSFGATSAKQLPQELLVHGRGDPGRRCYPLALVMAAALEKGDAAERALIGRLASANLASDDPETHIFLRALDELRSFPMKAFGEKLGPANLVTIMQTLEAKTSTSSLMFNTDNHSLLVSKVVARGGTSYRFYDPNFSIYGFERVEDLQRGIESYLSDRTLAGLYGIEAASSAVFNLIELNGSSIADTRLPSQVSTGELLHKVPIVRGQEVERWQYHALLRARSLSENARLGRAVAELEGTRWAQTIESSTLRLVASKALKPGFVPLYETLTQVEPGKWTLSMINSKDPQEIESVTVDDPRLSRIKNWLSERFKAMGESPQEGLPHEAGAVNTLNSGFAILALMHSLSRREEADAPMTLAVRLHSYVIYSQVLHGVGSDAVGVIRLVRQALLDERVIAATASSALGRTLGRVVGEGVGSVLALVNVGFDIYELVTADNSSLRAAVAVQLSFDLLGLALALTAAVVGGSVAAVAGPLAVVVGGVAYGVGALAGNYLRNLYSAQQVGVYFYRLKSAVKAGGFTVESGVFHPMSEVVVSSVDLQTLRVTLGSHLLLGAHRSGSGLPSINGDTSQAININHRWGVSEHPLLISRVQAMILPCTPRCFFGYDYQLMPGGTHRHDLGFDELRELEYDAEGERTFWFDPWTPFEYLVYKLFPGYEPTHVEIVLDSECRSLYVPAMPHEFQGKISYDISGAQGRYSLSLNPGVVSVQLSTLDEPASVQWLVRATWVGDAAVMVELQGLTIDGIQLLVATDTEVQLELAKGQLFRVDWSILQLVLLEERLPDDNDALALRERLTRLSHEHRIASPYLPLQNLKVPFVDPQWPIHTNGFYETERERILYTRDLPGVVNAEIQLAAVMGDEVYFYHRDRPTVWRVDALTSKVNRRYRLFNPRTPSSIVSCHDAGGAIRVVQQVTNLQGAVYQFDYLLHPDKVELNAVTTTSTGGLPITRENISWQGWKSFVEDFDTSDTIYDDDSLEMLGDILPWTTAAVISLQIQSGAQNVSAWVRVRDDWFVSSFELGLQSPVLLASWRDDDASLVFYDAQAKTLSRWVRQPGPAKGVLHALLNEVDSVLAVDDGYLAQTLTGLVFEVHDDNLFLRSLNEQWLAAQGDWLAALKAVAERYPVSGFDIVGLSDVGGRPLAARYVEGQILLVGAEQGRNLQALSLTPDKKALWLFAPDSGYLYRHSLLTIEQMNSLFGSSTRSVRHDPSYVPQRAWRPWSFADVKVQDGGLKGRTREGVIVELSDGQSALLVGVEDSFFNEHDSANLRKSKLMDLVAMQRHAPFLSTGQYGDVFSWYDTDIRRRFFTTLSDIDSWPAYLGMRKDANPLLHNPLEQQLFSNKEGDWWGREHELWAYVDAAYRENEVLTITCRDNIDDLLPLIPDGVTTLVLGYAQGQMACHLSQEAWLRLDCLIVDFDHLEPRKRQLSMGSLSTDCWLVTLADGHLVLTDPSDGRSLVFLSAKSADAASRQHLELSIEFSGESLLISLEDLMEGVEEGVSVELVNLLRGANEV